MRVYTEQRISSVHSQNFWTPSLHLQHPVTFYPPSVAFLQLIGLLDILTSRHAGRRAARKTKQRLTYPADRNRLLLLIVESRGPLSYICSRAGEAAAAMDAAFRRPTDRRA